MMAADPTGGYWTVTSAGEITPHGAATALGSPALSNLRLAQPIVGMTATADGNGYWLVASDGGIFSYGDATFYGSTGGIHLNKPIVGMAATNDGRGYWLVASDGGIFSYGDATFYGSTGSIVLNKPVVGMAVTTDGGGYWLVASDGGIFSYGDASFYGSTGSIRLNLPIVGLAPTPDGRGYCLVGFDGGVFTFGDANFYGSTAGWGVYAYGMIINPATAGYDIVTANGASVAFGPGLHPNAQSAELQQGAYDATPTPSGMAAFAQQTDSSPTVATDYLPGNAGWSGMDGSGGSLNWLLAPWGGAATRSPWACRSFRPTRAGRLWARSPRARQGPLTPTTSRWRKRSWPAVSPTLTSASVGSSTARGRPGRPPRPARKPVLPPTSSRS